MMILHGSNSVVEQPKILPAGRLLDFGTGFYTTSNREQAKRWARQVTARRQVKTPLLSIYEFDLKTAEREIPIIRFDSPNQEWLDFVCANRNGREIFETYDIAIGPVADDRVYSVVQFYENGVYDMAYALQQLKVVELYNQILFHSEKALTFLQFIGMEELVGNNCGNEYL